MTSLYPGGLDSYSTKVDGVDDVMAADINDPQDAIEALEAQHQKRSLRKIKNLSGATVAVNKIGYFDVAGDFVTTATASLLASPWAAVISGGANNTQIVVGQGRVTIELTANCSIGDFLISSTTTGRAGVVVAWEAAVLAVALTANTDGAGGTCEAMLFPEIGFWVGFGVVVDEVRTRNSTLDLGDDAGGDINFNSGQMFLEGSSGNAGFGTIAPGAARVKIQQTTDSLAGGVQITDSADLRPFGIGFITGGRWKVGTTYNASWTLVANSTDVLTFGFNGLVGIGITVPQGKVHAYDAISGFLLWEYDGLDATVRTIIPNGTGDVLYRTRFQYIMRNSAGVSASGDKFLTTPSSSAIVVGADTVTITLNADGSMTAARTAGSNTIKVALTLRWL